MNKCIDCAKGTCDYFCPVHLVHHPVKNMVEFCREKAIRLAPKTA